MGGRKKNWGRGRGKKNPPARTDCSFEKLRSWANGVSDWCGRVHSDWYLPINAYIASGSSCRAFKKMADSLTFDAALEESLSFLSELGMSRQLRHEQKEAISTLVHGSDLLAVLPTGFGKSRIFQLLIRVQEIIVFERCVRDCCLSAEKHRSRSVNWSFFNGIIGDITCKCKNRRCRKRKIPADLCVRRGNINEALPLVAQKEQLAVAPKPCRSNCWRVTYCGNLDRTKVCSCVTFKLILLFKSTLH